MSFLVPLLNTGGSESSRFQSIVKQEVEVAEIAEAEYRNGILNGAQCLYAWLMHTLLECDQRASTEEETMLIALEAERVELALTKIEEQMENLLSQPSTSALPSANRGFLTLPMAQFLTKFSGCKSKDDVYAPEKTNVGKKEHVEVSQSKSPRNQVDAETSTAKFKPEIRTLVTTPSSGNFPAWETIIGFDDIKKMVYQDYIVPRLSPQKFEESPKQSLVFFGPPGNGKTLFAKALAGSLNYPMLQITEADYTSSYIGESLIKLKACFEVAIEIAPCVLFIDEVESVAPNRFKIHSEHKKQEVNQLINNLNELEMHNIANPHKEVLFLSATNIPFQVDGAIWRRTDVRIHVELPTESERRMIIEDFLGKQICAVMNSVDWKTFYLHTKGFASSDIIKLCKDIFSVPRKISMNSEFFRPLHSFRVPKTETKKGCEFPSFESYASGWMPCSKAHPQAVRKDYTEIMEDVINPPITVRHIITCARARPPSLNIYDKEGPVIMCAKFAELSAQQVGIIFTAEDDESFDSNTAYEDAKMIYQKTKEGEGDPGSKLAKWTAPQRDVERVTLYKGKMVPVEVVYEMQKNAVQKCKDCKKKFK